MLTHPPTSGTRRRKIVSAARRGLSTPMLLMVVMSALLFIVLAIDLAQLLLQRQQMQTGADAAVIAAVPQLMDRRWLYLGPEGSGESEQDMAQRLSGFPEQQAMYAVEDAQKFALSNKVAGQPIEFDANDPDVVKIGYVNDPTSGNPTMDPPEETDALNSIGLELTRSKLGGNPPVLWMAKQTGLDSIDIVIRAQACVDTRIHGFQPLPHVNVPIVPLGLFEHREEGDADVHDDNYSANNNPDMPAQVWWARGPARRGDGQSDSGFVGPGGDGIAEMVFRIQANGDSQSGDGEDNDPTARPSGMLGFDDHDSIFEQFARLAIDGVTAGDLASYGGTLTLSDDNPALVPAKFSFSSEDLSMISDLLHSDELQGRPRIWPVVADCSSVTGEPTLGIIGFVAGCVVKCDSDADGSLLVTIQPCLLQTPTALTAAVAQQNPWIGKLLLVR